MPSSSALGKQADEILASAHAGIRSNRSRQGFEQGLEEGRLQMAEEMMDSVAKTVDYFEGIERQMATLVAKATRKVIGDHG